MTHIKENSRRRDKQREPYAIALEAKNSLESNVG